MTNYIKLAELAFRIHPNHVIAWYLIYYLRLSLVCTDIGLSVFSSVQHSSMGAMLMLPLEISEKSMFVIQLLDRGTDDEYADPCRREAKRRA